MTRGVRRRPTLEAIDRSVASGGRGRERQLLLGILLGGVWTPCTGPTLAGALGLAARSDTIARAATIMLAFGVGAAVPVVLVAYGSRRVAAGRERRLAALAGTGKLVMGVLLLLVGALALTGVDKIIEAWLVDRMPAWLLDLTTAL